MILRFCKRMLSCLVALCLFAFCFNTASAMELNGGTSSGAATPITLDMLGEAYSVKIPWAVNTVQYWYTVTPPSAGDLYIAAQQTSGYSSVYIQIFQGEGAIDDAQPLSANQEVFPVHVENENDTVVFCIYCSMPSGSKVDFSVCFDGYHAMGTTAKSIKSATCQETGLRAIMCTLCGSFGPTEETPITDHISGEWKVFLDPTCDADGVKVHLCAACGEVMSTGSVPARHTYGRWVIAELPTADAAGVQMRTCTVCDNVETKEIPISE